MYYIIFVINPILGDIHSTIHTFCATLNSIFYETNFAVQLAFYFDLIDLTNIFEPKFVNRRVLFSNIHFFSRLYTHTPITSAHGRSLSLPNTPELKLKPLLTLFLEKLIQQRNFWPNFPLERYVS